MPRRWCRRSISRRQRYASGEVSVRSASMTNPASSSSASTARNHGTTAAPPSSPGNSASTKDVAIGATKRCWLWWVASRSDVPGVVLVDLDQVHVLGPVPGAAGPGGAAVDGQRRSGRRRPTCRRCARPSGPCPRTRTRGPRRVGPTRTLAGSSVASDAMDAEVVEEPVDDGADGLPGQPASLARRSPASTRSWPPARRRPGRRPRHRRGARRASTAICTQSPAHGTVERSTGRPRTAGPPSNG